VRREAEERLKTMLKKDDFARMEVVGQFNKAFILARLGPDLFMIDQHASDEIYNFERYQSGEIIKSQLLASAVRLSLGVQEELVLRDNVHVFRQIGYDFYFNEYAEPGEKVMVNRMPDMAGNRSFDKSDIDEILGVLLQSQDQRIRSDKLRKVLASRACRNAVMIGDTLDEQKMKEIIHNMGTMNLPWNCPHGRPTIRHLCHFEGETKI